MKIISIGLISLVAVALLLGSCIFYEYNRKIDRTPIVEIPFDPSKKEPINVNVKIPRRGVFQASFHIRHKNGMDDLIKVRDYSMENIFEVKYKIIRNGKVIKEEIKKPFPDRIYELEQKSVKYFSFYLETVSNKMFNTKDDLNIIIENQYLTEKFKDFEIVFRIHEVHPAK